MNPEDKFEQISARKHVLIWGAGYHTKEVLRFYQSFFSEKELWIVDQNTVGTTIENYPVLSPDEIDYSHMELAVIMTAIHHAEVEHALKHQYGYSGLVIGLYAFRRLLLKLDSYEECRCHLHDFISHMENGCPSYSYDYIFREHYRQYQTIKLFAFWSSSIGESIRYLAAYYETAFQHKKEDEYYLLVPYIKGNDFANGRFIEIVSRTVPMITHENCHFWSYLLERYPERFDLNSYNDYNGILVDVYDQFDPRIPKGCFCDVKFPIVSYLSEEVNEAKDRLREMGVHGDYVCIFARDQAYLQHQYGQSYSFNDIRDMDIGSFRNAAKYLHNQNIQTIRMGKVVNQPVELPNCIDYASKYHNDLMDLYLCGKCKFYAGSLSGIVEMAQLQDVPVLLLGLVQLEGYHSIPYRSMDIFVPKKIYDKKNKRFLRFTEMWDAEIAAGDTVAQYYEKRGLEFIELEESEIETAIIEMNEKVDGIYMEDEYERQLQKKYHDLFDQWIAKNGYQYFYFQHINVSGSFIKKNAFLLD